MARVVKSLEALEDGAQIWAYIGQNNAHAADRLSDHFDEKLIMLAEYPGVGTKRDELQPGLRSFAVGEYILFYRTISDGIELVRILHGKRDIPDVIHA